MANSSSEELPVTMNHIFDTTDFKFIVEETEFPVHRRILMRSSYFAPLFEHPQPKEIQSGKLVLYYVKKEAFAVYLKYIYDGEVPDASRVTHDLLDIAYKFQDNEFKDDCEAALVPALSSSTFFRLFILAHKFHLEALNAACVEFFRDHRLTVLNSPEWDSSTNACPTGFLKLLRQYALQVFTRYDELYAENQQLRNELRNREGESVLRNSGQPKRARIN